MVKTPILFLIFNRPDTTRKVFEQIRKAQPSELFIAADGPRENVPVDTKNCKEVREIVSQVDWPCKVQTLFRKKNLGCKVAVSGAIDWFFTHVEAGIILEDDCLPDQSFFPFCEDLLNRYREQPKVMMISGFNTKGVWDYPKSYFYSQYTAIWGWATWRRAWKHYDVTMRSWLDKNNQKHVQGQITDKLVWKSKKWTYDKLVKNEKDTWDYQWEYALLLNKGLSIVPISNLIENIGFQKNGTHTTDKQDQKIPEIKPITFPLIYNDHFKRDRVYDAYFTERFYSARSLFQKIIDKIRIW